MSTATIVSAGTGSRYLAALRTPRGLTGLVVILALAGAGLAAVLLYPQGYDAQSADALRSGSFPSLFGTDEIGRDVLARSLFGLRTNLSLVGLAVPASALVGTVLGLSGYLSAWLGTLVQRALDVVLGFPSLILGIAIALVLRPGWWALCLAIFVYTLPPFGRLARATLLAQQQREYVLAAQLMRVSRGRIMLRHILPHAADAIIVQLAAAMVSGIFLESSLSIVGLGIQPPEPSLGALLNTGMRYMHSQPLYILGPALLLLLLAWGLILLSDALNEAVLAR